MTIKMIEIFFRESGRKCFEMFDVPKSKNNLRMMK